MRAAAVFALRGVLAVTPVVTAGCGENYSAVLDSLPIALKRAPMGDPMGLGGPGALVALAAPPDVPGPSFDMLVDTGTSLTLLAADGAAVQLATERAGFDLLDPASPDPNMPVVRGSFRGVSLLRLPLLPVGDGSVVPGGVLSGDILSRYSVDFRFGATCPPPQTGLCSSMTFWGHLGADLGFLQDSGYAVIRFSLFGGGEVTADGDPDFLGQRAPLVVPATRILFRTCAVPDVFTPEPFSPAMPRPACCKEADADQQKSGVDLALMLDTGVGPLVLGARAWERIKNRLMLLTVPEIPVETSGELRIATWPAPIPAIWSTISRFALVDLETGAGTDPGPCVELARARRIERVSAQIVRDMDAGLTSTACTLPCDNDPREADKAQNSAAYLELAGQIPVAVIGDEERYLQGLRFDIRPEGPEVDGVIGAGALGRSRVEIDYVSAPHRAVFSCELDAPPECRAVARCPRLPDASYQHRCFGLRLHGLAPTCPASGC